MKRYMLVASRDPFTARDIDDFYALAGNLAARGETVSLFLVQNGVFPARRGPGADRLTGLARSGVAVLADGFSLRERGIPSDRLAAGVSVADVDLVVDALADGVRVLWT